MKSSMLKWVAVVVVSSLVSVVSAVAEISHPDGLQAIENYSPAQAPYLVNGMSSLSQRESRYQEKLPLQLSGAIKKVKSRKYSPGKRSKKI